MIISIKTIYDIICYTFRHDEGSPSKAPLVRWCLGFAPGSCRWNPGWIFNSLGGWMTNVGRASDTANFLSFSSLSSWWFLEIMIWVQWPGWGSSFFLDGDQRTLHMSICTFYETSTVLGSIPKYNVCECSHGVIEWFWESPFPCKHNFVRATVTTVIECPGFDAHGSVLPSSSHWQPSRQLENRILLQKMLNIDTKPSQVHGFLRGPLGVLAFPDVRESLLGI